MPTKRYLLIALLASGACRATTPAVDAGRVAPADTSIQLRVPREIGAFRFVSRQEYDDPDLGISVRYRQSDSLTADVYFYPGPDLGELCPLGCAREHLQSEIDTTIAAMREFERQGRLQSMRVVESAYLTPPRGARWRLGHRMQLAWQVSDVIQRSEFWLVYLPNTKIKVRSTFVETPARLAAVEELLRAVVPTVTSPAPPRDERPLPAATSADTTFSLLAGTWDWEMSNDECVRGAHTLAASSDRRELVLTVPDSRDSTGAVETTRYRILDVGPHLLPGAPHTIRLAMEGETRRTPAGALVLWDLVFRSRDRYDWRRTDWPADGATEPVIRCDAPSRRIP